MTSRLEQFPCHIWYGYNESSLVSMWPIQTVAATIQEGPYAHTLPLGCSLRLDDRWLRSVLYARRLLGP